jgi:hypothetical protein
MRYLSRRSMIESSQSSWSRAGAVVTNFERFDLLDPRRRGGRGWIGIALRQDWGRSAMSTILLIQRSRRRQLSARGLPARSRPNH